MILLTVGTQLPFTRLISAMDRLAPRLKSPVFAQIGQTQIYPKHMDYASELDPIAFGSLLNRVDLIVSHAGIGTVLSAQKHGKPIIIFPRQAKFGEHRNDHQLATVRQLEGRPGIYVARDENRLEELLLTETFSAGGNVHSETISGLLDSIENCLRVALR